MCNVSMIMDTYRPHIPQQWPPNTTPVVQQWKLGTPAPPKQPVTADELRELLDSFKAAVAAAQTFDRLTGQPDCVDPEKAELEDRVAALEARLAELEAA